MYNRYVPQNDGTWRRSRVETPKPPPAPQNPVCADTEETICMDPVPEAPHHEPPRAPQKHPVKKSPHCPREQPVGSFLKNLLPSNFDTGDLVILLLLLLIAGDDPENKTTALLTLGIYLMS